MVWENFIARSRRASFVAGDLGSIYDCEFDKSLLWRSPDGSYFCVTYFKKNGCLCQMVENNLSDITVRTFIEHSDIIAPEYELVCDKFRSERNNEGL